MICSVLSANGFAALPLVAMVMSCPSSISFSIMGIPKNLVPPTTNMFNFPSLPVLLRMTLQCHALILSSGTAFEVHVFETFPVLGLLFSTNTVIGFSCFQPFTVFGLLISLGTVNPLSRSQTFTVLGLLISLSTVNPLSRSQISTVLIMLVFLSTVIPLSTGIQPHQARPTPSRESTPITRGHAITRGQPITEVSKLSHHPTPTTFRICFRVATG